MNKVEITVEIKDPSGRKISKSGLSFKFFEDDSTDRFLKQMREAVDAMYKHMEAKAPNLAGKYVVTDEEN